MLEIKERDALINDAEDVVDGEPAFLLAPLVGIRVVQALDLCLELPQYRQVLSKYFTGGPKRGND